VNSTIQSELEALEQGALVRRLDGIATLRITGSERQSWLAGMVTSDIKGLRPGDGAYALSVNKNGRIQAEMWISIRDDEILLAVDASLGSELYQAFDQYLIMEDAEITLEEPGRRWWLAHGPEAAAVADAGRAAGASAASARWGDIATAIINATTDVTDALLGAKGARLASAAGWEWARIERMLPRFGVDFEVGMYPQEATLENLAVSFNKGCYIGQEAVFMLEKRGHVSKRLVRLKIDGHVDLEKGMAITNDDGKNVGEVTSAVRDDGLSYALAMVRYKYTESGTRLHIGEHVAEVSCLSTRENACS
jgi:folate-binding protein YgfZ